MNIENMKTEIILNFGRICHAYSFLNTFFLNDAEKQVNVLSTSEKIELFMKFSLLTIRKLKLSLLTVFPDPVLSFIISITKCLLFFFMKINTLEYYDKLSNVTDFIVNSSIS